jgi:SAM-dependent methyltransferase
MLTKSEYRQYLLNGYKPTQYEEFGTEDLRFPTEIKYSHISWTRTYSIYRMIAKILSRKPSQSIKILDIGFYPGNLIRILKDQFGDKIECYGVGLKADLDFQNTMRSYIKDCDNIDFDVFYLKTAEPVRSKFEANTFDVVIAAEILEHLISPLEMIETGARLLREGGVFILTTPNVSHIGAVVKLLFGRTNYERLHRSPMYLPNDEWRGHIRFYDKHELVSLFQKYSLRLTHHRYYTEAGWDHVIRSLPQRFVYQMKKLFWFIPIYREGHFAIFERNIKMDPGGPDKKRSG